MKTNKTELVFILDKSGSMSGMEKDTISRKYDWEIFSVERTSKQCYRCTYTDILMGKVKYFTAKSPEKLIRKMEKLSKTSTMSGEDNRK